MCVITVDAVGTGLGGATNGAIGIGVTAFPTKVPTEAGERSGTIRLPMGVALHRLGIGVIVDGAGAKR
jgi:hypothetical protein